MTIMVTVKLRSSKSALIETAPGYFEARLTQPPEKGKANAELIRLLSAHLDVPPSRIVITSGTSNRKKMVEIA